MYEKINCSSVIGVQAFEYFSVVECSLLDFYNYIISEIDFIKRKTGVFSINVNLSYIDNSSIIHYYCIKDIDSLKSCILEGELTAVLGGGGSDGENDEFTVSISTRRFRISAIDESGGFGYIQADFYTYLDISSSNGDNSCLIDCFKAICHSYVIEEEIRSYLNVESGSRLGTKHIGLLEDYFDIKVCVLRDEYDLEHGSDGSYKYIPRVIYGDIKADNKILYKNNHYGMIAESKVPHEVYSSKLIGRSMEVNKFIGTHYYFFDYETVYDPDTYILQPYSFAVVKCDANGSIIDKFFRVESSSLTEYLQIESARHIHYRKYLIGFNNSRFDNFFMLKEAVRRVNQSVENTFFMNNTILSTTINNFEVLDLCRILNTSLDNACKSFKLKNQKLSLNHSDVQSMFNEGVLSRYITDNYDRIKEYNLMDVITLSELFFKTKYELKKLCDVDVENYMTLAGMSYDIFKSLNKGVSMPVHTFNESDIIRKSVYGGRAQIFNKGEYNREPLCCIDCVSLYPYVMLNNIFPLGDSDITHKYMSDKIGVYEVLISNQPKINIIPLRKKYESLDWCAKEMKCVVTSQDLDILLKYGCDAEILDGLYWADDKGGLFGSYFSPIVLEKVNQDSIKNTEEYNPALRELCKLLMNSLSGKLIQQDYDEIVEIIKSKDDLAKFRQKCRENIRIIDMGEEYCIVSGTLQEYVNKMPTIYGSLIYSYARSHMYDTILSKVNYNELYGMDTDSAFITKRQYDELKDKYPKIFGDEFGQFKEEILELVDNNSDEKGPYGIFVAPKCYCFYKIDKDDNEVFIKARFKGINLDRDKIWANDLCFEDMCAKELNELYHGDTLKSIDVEFYRKCLTSDVMILHSNLSKKIFDNKDYINIKQHFCVKHIKLY